MKFGLGFANIMSFATQPGLTEMAQGAEAAGGTQRKLGNGDRGAELQPGRKTLGSRGVLHHGVGNQMEIERRRILRGLLQLRQQQAAC